MGYVLWGLIRMYVLLYREQQLCGLLAFVFNSSSLPLLLQNPLIGSSSVLGSWKARKWPSSRRPLKISTTLSLSTVSSLYV